MKKTYIEPKNTVVALRVRSNIMSLSGDDGKGQKLFNDGGETYGKGEIIPDAREVLNIPDPWEEW